MPTPVPRLLARTLALACLLSPLAARAADPTLDQMAVTGLNDLQATVTVVKADQSELEKINRDFGMAYRLKDLVMRYKEPGKLRMEGRIGVMIVNGSTRYFRVPQLRYTRRDELGNTPTKRRSLLDVGLITRSGVAGMTSKFLRTDMLGTTPVAVFEAGAGPEDGTRLVLWVDPLRKVILKREWFDGSGKLRATFLYQEPREVKPGLWVPMRIEIQNAAGAIAGVTAYSDLKVNQGLDDALFKIS